MTEIENRPLPIRSGLRDTPGGVTAHHGEIQVDSELGEGTVVRIWLPTKVVAVASEEMVENPSLTASHLGELTLWLDEGAAQTANTEGVAS